MSSLDFSCHYLVDDLNGGLGDSVDVSVRQLYAVDVTLISVLLLGAWMSAVMPSFDGNKLKRRL